MDPATLLRAIRRDRKLSQRELAELVGVPRSTVDRIESGRMQRPGFLLIERILQSSGYSLRVLDTWGRELDPVEHWDGEFDRGGRRFPAHLALLPVPGHLPRKRRHPLARCHLTRVPPNSTCT